MSFIGVFLLAQEGYDGDLQRRLIEPGPLKAVELVRRASTRWVLHGKVL